MQLAGHTAKKLTSLVLLASLVLGLVATSLPKAAYAAAEYTLGFSDTTAQTIEEGNSANFLIVPSSVIGQFEASSNFQINYEIIPTGDFDTADFTFNGSSNLTGTISFIAQGGQDAVLVPLTITDDAVVEAVAESFVINLTTVTDLNGNNTAVIDPGSDSINVTVQDYNGDPKLNFATSEIDASEDQSEVFTVTLSRPAATDVSFDWDLDGNNTAIGPISNPDPNNPENDFQAVSLFASSTILAGTVSLDLPVTIFNDTVDELDETIGANITAVTAGSAVIGPVSTLIYTILDNDTVAASFSEASSSGLESVTTDVIEVTLSNPSDREVRVYLDGDMANSTGAGSEWNLLSGTLIFAPGDIKENATLAIVDDTEFESDETGVIYITGVEVGSETGTTSTPATYTYTITNDDPAPPAPVYGTAIPQSTASVGGVPTGSAVVVPPATPTSVVTAPAPTPAPTTPPTPTTGEVLGTQITALDELIAKLAFNTTSDEVSQLQTQLQNLGFFPAIKTTGFYGPITKKAVEKYMDGKQWPLDQLVAMLRYNNRGASVAALQTQLRNLTYFPHWVRSTGWFGPITQGAITKYEATR